jgi:hypothetical protein
MAEIRSPFGSKITPYELSNEEYYWIGRLVRATSELEDIINEHFVRVSRLSYGAAIIILGKMPSSGRLSIAKQFAKAHGGDVLAAHNECFEDEAFRHIIKTRNALVHGFLMGKTELGHVAFEIQETQGVEGQEVVVSVFTLPDGAIRAYALKAEAAISHFEERLNVKASRAERRLQELGPHTKAQDKPRGGQKRPRQS